MIIAAESQTPVREELDLITEYVPLSGSAVLELGCGRAAMTRAIAEGFEVESLIATEVDHVQHEKNLLIDDLANVTFRYGGAQEIDASDASFDRVFLFKSLHHVPEALMAPALNEIARVLRKDGLVWISEPVHAGDFNELMSLFHDEEQARQAAFDTILNAIDIGLFTLERQIFFDAERHFGDFVQFEEQILGVTHTELDLDEATYTEVRKRFNARCGDDGATFRSAMRIDLLRRC